jgi:hypothetical protein
MHVFRRSALSDDTVNNFSTRGAPYWSRYQWLLYSERMRTAGGSVLLSSVCGVSAWSVIIAAQHVRVVDNHTCTSVTVLVAYLYSNIVRTFPGTCVFTSPQWLIELIRSNVSVGRWNESARDLQSGAPGSGAAWRTEIGLSSVCLLSPLALGVAFVRGGVNVHRSRRRARVIFTPVSRECMHCSRCT